MKVLITGAGALLGQGLIRALRASSLRAYIIAVDPNPESVGLYWADAAHLVPMAGPGYGEAISRLLKIERPDAVLVGTDVELAFFASHRHELEREFGTKIVVSDSKVVEIADDKWLTYKFLKDNNFSHPDTVVQGDEAALIERVGFPLIVKPRRGARSVGMSLANNADELQAALAHRRDLLVQECVGTAADEYTSGLICFDGRCLASITMRREIREGNTYRAYPLPDFAQDGVLRRVAEALGPGVYGPINLQFRMRGECVKIFEINSRFSGTTPFRGFVGFPEVEMVLRRLLLNDSVTQPRIRTDVILRHWSETVVPESRLVSGDK